MSEATVGKEHWVTKQHKSGPSGSTPGRNYLPQYEGQFTETLLLVHGSSMASTPSFDLQVPGHGDEYSAMDYFARLGYDVWCFDCEGYGRSDKTRDTDFFVARRRRRRRGRRPIHRSLRAATTSCWSTACRPAPCARRCWPNATLSWSSASCSTLSSGPARARRRSKQRRKNLPNFNRRRSAGPIDLDFVRSIFMRDHPGTADDEVIEAFANAIVKLDDSTSPTAPTSTCATTCR